MTDFATPGNPWATSPPEVVDRMQVDPPTGLDQTEAKRRRRSHGPNKLKKTERRSAFHILLDQFENLIVILLAAAAVLSFSFGKWLEGISITIAIAVNGGIGFFTELKAVRSMEALHRMSRVTSKVRRQGRIQEIPAEELVPGDMVLVEGGDMVSADLRLTEANRMEADESALTGESVPVSKDTEPLEEDTPLAERSNMLFKGTFITRGTGEGVAVATGMDTELGKIATLAEEAEEEETPLEKRLDRLGYRLIWVTLAIAGAIIISGLLVHKDVLLIIETAIALAVAAIPEGLPIVATIALARGMWRMSRHNAVMNRLSAVETLGATNVIFTDKTGTLTENRMNVTRIVLPSGRPGETTDVHVARQEGQSSFSVEDQPVTLSNYPNLRDILETGVLCNNAQLNPERTEHSVGDPTEIALLEAGVHGGLFRGQILKESLPEVREEAFDPDVMMMATVHRENNAYRVAVKGAPGAVLEACSQVRSHEGDRELKEEDRTRWDHLNDRLAGDGLRVLAAATKTIDSPDADPYEGLTFLGLLGLLDPPRSDVAEAVEACRTAGIRVIMVTGDQPATARAVGVELGLAEAGSDSVVHSKDLPDPKQISPDQRGQFLRASVFARVTPQQKLNLIALHQTAGSVVAMTGDGVNDAPALRKADIGVAMGKRGTQVAREASDMILKDDALGTITVAIQQGRAIFDNLRRFIVFLLSGNVGEIMIVATALLIGAPLPLLPLQILYLNMIGDVFPALALGVGRGDPSKMNRPPRDPGEPILTRGHWFAICGYGAMIAVPVLGGFWVALNPLAMNVEHAVTVSFLSLAFARLWHAFNMRDQESPLFFNDITRNPFVWGALALCTALLLAAAYVPGLSYALSMHPPGTGGWALILGTSLVPLLIGQLVKTVRFQSSRLRQG